MRAILFGMLFAFSASSHALMLGKPQPARAPMCMSKASAMAIAKADSEVSLEAAQAAFQAADDCGFGQAVVLPLRVIWRGPTARGATVSVIETEVTINDKVHVVFMLTDGEIENLQRT